jgi:hypothetical protein
MPAGPGQGARGEGGGNHQGVREGSWIAAAVHANRHGCRGSRTFQIADEAVTAGAVSHDQFGKQDALIETVVGRSVAGTTGGRARRR